MARLLVARIPACTLAVALAGCGSFVSNQAAASTLTILEQSSVAARRLGDPQLAREAMPAGIVQLEAFALAYPDRREFRVRHADALCQYANAFVFDDWEDATLAGRTGDAARIAARLDRLLGACIDANRALLPAGFALANATRAEVPALRWIATAGALRLALAPLQHLTELPAITQTLERCVALWPGFHDADGELTLGMLAANRPAFLGGDDGARYFDAAQRQLGDGALMAEVLRARALLVRARDRAGLEAALQRVLDADVARWPERRLTNELARTKAARYLAAIDQLIPAS